MATQRSTTSIVNRAQQTQVFWLTPRRDDTSDSLAADEASPRYLSGTLGALLAPPPYQLPEARRLAEEQVIWLAGAPGHNASVRGIPSIVDVSRADPLTCSDAHRVAVRSAPDNAVR